MFDKGTFDRLLADRLSLPELSPTLQAMADLHALRPLSHLGPEASRPCMSPSRSGCCVVCSILPTSTVEVTPS